MSSQIKGPKTHRPELVNVETPISQDEKMRRELGLGKDDSVESGEDEPNSPGPIPKKKPAKAKVEGGSDNDALLKELKAKNEELEKRLLTEGTRKDEQVETIKKLANSRMANITKSFEEKLASKEREYEELQSMSAIDVEQLCATRNRCSGLEKQVRGAGLEPVQAEEAEGGGEGDATARLTAELARLRKDNAQLLASKGNGAAASSNGAGGGGGGNPAAEAENKELKKTVDKLTLANETLLSKTKRQIDMLELEVEKHRPGGAGGGDAAPQADTGASTAALHKIQAQLEGEVTARARAEKEVGELKGKLEKQKAELEAAAGKAQGSSEAKDEIKKLQKELHERDKAVGLSKQALKAAEEDATTAKNHLERQVLGLEQEASRVKQEGSTQLQEIRGKIKKHGRKVLQDLANLRASQQAVKAATAELQVGITPAMKEFYQPLKKHLAKYEKVNSGWAEKYKKEVAERKRLHNLVLELKGNIRVFLRVRPSLPHETGEGVENAVFFPDERPDLEENTIAIYDEAKGTEKIFEWDATFGSTSKQEEVFQEVEALVTSVLDGYNVCIFAYGQTGSGKTYTMEGSDTEKGINPRTLERVFELIGEKSRDYSYTLEFTVLEIYNEDIKDLLDPKAGKKCEVRQGPEGNFVQDLKLFEVKNFEEVNKLWSDAKKNRTTFSNNINEHSSRSHLVISLYVRGTNLASGVQSFGKLHLVDLAGSERLSRTNATGDRLKEAQNINKSLSALGDVIAAAANKNGHIPYRNSKLTHVLQDSLGQDSKTLMIVQTSPCTRDVAESICSLQFASRARAVELGQAKKNLSQGAKKK